jgi:hypothetical protein
MEESWLAVREGEFIGQLSNYQLLKEDSYSILL